MPKSAWTEKDQIDNFLKERRLMRSLEKFVGGRLYKGDLRLYHNLWDVIVDGDLEAIPDEYLLKFHNVADAKSL
ncbi:hypothetical protein Tco_1069993 [Tanacetum coccineum]|uniref:Uncharacterized protein n=1 Tax=Tanacetum coccineum TaxID=301880 RepID=A0ABQ5HK69_9ASTR